MDDFELLERLGVPVVECEIHDEVCWVSDQRVGLIRPDLTPTRRLLAGAWLLSIALYQGSAN